MRSTATGSFGPIAPSLHCSNSKASVASSRTARSLDEYGLHEPARHRGLAIGPEHVTPVLDLRGAEAGAGRQRLELSRIAARERGVERVEEIAARIADRRVDGVDHAAEEVRDADRAAQ